jgi:hypothetical protein
MELRYSAELNSHTRLLRLGDMVAESMRDGKLNDRKKT